MIGADKMLETALTPDDFHCDRKTTCCFTGHRKRSLPDSGDAFAVKIKALKSHIGFLIKEAYDEGYHTFITGMADGVDLFAAAEVISLSKEKSYENIRLVCAVPYPGQFNEMKTPADRYIYELLLREAYQIVLVSDAYHEGCYRQRNQFMIDHSSLLIAAANRNSKSGSAQTINMAKRQAVPVRLIDTTGEPYSL